MKSISRKFVAVLALSSVLTAHAGDIRTLPLCNVQTDNSPLDEARVVKHSLMQVRVEAEADLFLTFCIGHGRFTYSEPKEVEKGVWSVSCMGQTDSERVPVQMATVSIFFNESDHMLFRMNENKCIEQVTFHFEMFHIRQKRELQYKIGANFYAGKGVPQDYTTAMAWWAKSADTTYDESGSVKGGYDKAQYALGVMYDQGLGVPKNYKTAMQWYQEASKQGNGDAAYAIAVMIKRGIVVPKNRDNDPEANKSAYWFDVARSRGAVVQKSLDSIIADTKATIPQEKD